METAWRSDASGASGSEAALQTSDGSSSSDEPVGGDSVSRAARRKRGAECLAGGGGSVAHVEGGKADQSEPHQQSDTFCQLTVPQQRIINRVVAMLDSKRDSVVITNPLQPNGPIVYVTNAWQDMCGYTAQQAVGENPRLTQGEGTDPDTVRSMRLALTNQQPCRVRIINYRGYNREPFWNCLSVQPIFHNRKLVLFAARLQDYSYRLQQLVSVSPQQFCKGGDLYTMRVGLSDLSSAHSLGQARIVDVTNGDIGLQDDSSTSSDERTDASGYSSNGESTCAGGPKPPGMLPARHVRRLGFGGLELEPEYLLDRLRHECAQLALPYETQELRVQGAEVMRLEILSPPPHASGGGGDASSGESASSSERAGGSEGAAGSEGAGGIGGSASTAVVPRALPLAGGSAAGSGGLRALLHVLPEDTEGAYAISLMRLVGDTFEFHALYRALRDRLTDITVRG